jgi:hypothetical protein
MRAMSWLLIGLASLMRLWKRGSLSAFSLSSKRALRGPASLLPDRCQVWGRDPQPKALKGRVCTAADGSLMPNDAQ